MGLCRSRAPEEGTASERLLGIDEAGRGSLVGPLVVGGFCISSDRLGELVTLGARDSKLLSATARERVFSGLPALGTCAQVVLPPRVVDRAVRRGRLNDLEADAFARLVREMQPDVTYVDACDPNERRFGARVARLAGGTARVVARHHADRDHPVVGAASIVAKVQRDRAIARLRERLGEDLGSGYPSDERTIRFVRAALVDRPTTPSWVRSSWSTMQRVKPRRPARTLDGFVP
ncbi:MAG TPA: ribonuclease HII [Thermoplasmata archaeon]|nr:ribonuclease HII [Thermoplasmata archaeon]